MSSKKTTIHEFDPQIYPCRLWVGKQSPFEEVEEKFWTLTNEYEKAPIEESEYIRNRFVVATCYPVVEKTEGWLGVLMVIHLPKQMGVGKIAHEATHITDFLWERLGMEGYSFREGEPRAYFTEWVANCIDFVRKYKEVKNGGSESKCCNKEDLLVEKTCEAKEEVCGNG